MTRYARAKGSKSSNEKTPNEATPWHMLKPQLNGNSSTQGHTEKPKSAKELLQDKDKLYCDVWNVNNDWAVFEESTPTETKKKKETFVTSNEVDSQKKSLKKRRNIDETGTSATNSKRPKKDRNYVERDEATTKHAKLNKKKKQNESTETSKKDKNLGPKLDNNLDTVGQDHAEKDEATPKHAKLKKNKKRSKQNDRQFSEASMNSSNVSQTVITEENVSKKGTLSKHNDRQWKKRNVDSESSNNNTIGRNKNSRSNNPSFRGPKFEKQRPGSNKKPGKVRDDKEHKRRKPDVDSTKLTINGMEIEVVKFDGFPIKKEDADRLRELKQKMIMKGIPKTELDAAMKLERRRAEKALAKIRRCVCFHCRKAGHNLSDCPELGSEQAGTGICFKCGSTEHTHFECKVAKPMEFRYAMCFICREQGHIAKQCPDNPRGIYPQGGSCKLCGDVTHLKKDCPDLVKEKEESTITVNTITGGNVESLEVSKRSVQVAENKRPKKVVKF
ncbi:uncharacterized protein LOC143217199 [Lasioglossum baleicum]|uniref:uncharacterized protein LOC143217199 n=1 Tax=Lasioglossum baleicum TaxID=434251 RepID=UPI003FCDAC83